MNPRETRIRAEITGRGLRLAPFGVGWRVYGAGVVDVIVSDLSSLTMEDLLPQPPNKRDYDPRAWR